MGAELAFSWLQFIGVVLAGAIFYYSKMLYKKGNFKRKDFWIWGGFSILLIVASIIPTFFNFIFALFTRRTLDTLLIFGLLVSFGLIFQVYVRLQQTNKDVTELVRKVALKFEEYKKSSRKRK
ncbi:TPA: DUF2304 domain-containing protein [archaeon]|uniref:DUF2304 domain-containing protein n=1 Tax=Candidatus Naiadarchaeum limnaeum TaxID=2756139 RepID=A0A832V4J5_9ARCH|nr:DUF2304 domain-containing protein [Candidatus Naiadarchaeales archaeon SRR2090153.bin1042]HIK00792.1 DUF2304 domain-containing protein [Candidatus Naiadarchaeum limnaeum]